MIYKSYFLRQKLYKGTLVNRKLQSLHGESLKNALTVPLNLDLRNKIQGNLHH